MGSRKRGRDEMEAMEPAPEPTMLDRIRNTWELANIMQYIYIFGRVVKIDEDLTIERIEEIGYDKYERHYIVLDDNRLYRRTEPPPPPAPKAKPKSNSKKGKAAARASKRRKTLDPEDSANDADVDAPEAEIGAAESKEDDGLGGRKWACIAVTLGQYQEFLTSIQNSRDPDEKYLHKRIIDEVLPIIEKAEESQVRKKQKQERELMNIQKLATAKRSSRLEAKMEREREEREAAEAEQKRKADLIAAKQDQEKQKKMEEARESRMMTREQRIKDREYKRLLHEEELANLSEENKKVEAGEAKKSERHLKTEMEKKKAELAALREDDEWIFDCAKCGKHGTNLDDGTHSVACDKCNVWQHSACLGITQAEAEKDDFHFVCHICKRREEDAKKPKIPSLKFHLGSSSSPPNQKPKVLLPGVVEAQKRKLIEEPSHLPPTKKFKPVDIKHRPQSSNPPRPVSNGQNEQNGQPAHYRSNGMHAALMDGPQLSPQGQVPRSIYAGNQEESFHGGLPSKPDTARPSPGPRSPAAAPGHANGHGSSYNPYVNQNGYSGYVPQLPLNAFQSPYAGNAPYGSHQPQNVGWSARYTPPQQAQRGQPYSQLPPSTNPYANSFDRQRPGSSHSTSNVPSPIKNGPSLSPPQHSPSAYNSQNHQTPQANHASYAQNPPYTNGKSSLHNLPPTGPPAYSPIKQQSPPAPPAVTHHALSSSPVAHQPPLLNNAPASPGFSPTKHSPPHQGPPVLADTPAVLPPAPQLSPGPILQNGGA
ncbi:hypothetical protein P7C71_g603, partial [Lecanoromycetidae sp. Uapishka_2]